MCPGSRVTQTRTIPLVITDATFIIHSGTAVRYLDSTYSLLFSNFFVNDCFKMGSWYKICIHGCCSKCQDHLMHAMVPSTHKLQQEHHWLWLSTNGEWQCNLPHLKTLFQRRLFLSSTDFIQLLSYLKKVVLYMRCSWFCLGWYWFPNRLNSLSSLCWDSYQWIYKQISQYHRKETLKENPGVDILHCCGQFVLSLSTLFSEKLWYLQ